MLRKMQHELGATGSWSPAQSGQNPSSTELNPVVVIGQRDQARDQIVPCLGATRYSIGQQQIQTQSQGANSGLGNRLGMRRMLGELMEEPIPE